MAINPQTAAYLSQLGELLTYVDPRGGPEGPHSVVAYRLVPTGGWHRGQRFPHAVKEDLDQAGYDKTTLEGIEYHLVPDESSNTPGTISHYAQRTGVQDLRNPIGENTGVNRVRDTFEIVDGYDKHTTAPDAVAKYVKESDNWEEARKKSNERDDRVLRQIRHGEGSEQDRPENREVASQPKVTDKDVKKESSQGTDQKAKQ